MRRLAAYTNRTLARVAIAAIRAREVQLVAAEAAGDETAAKEHLDAIASFERQLVGLERNPRPAPKPIHRLAAE